MHQQPAVGPGASTPAERTIKIIHPASFNPFGSIRHLGILADHLDLFLTLSLHRIRVRYKQSALGIAWALLQPLSLMLIYTLIFSVVTKMPSNGMPYAVFVYAALLPWTYFSSAVTSATSSLVSHINLVTKVYIPREILPFSYIVVGIFDFSIASLVLAGLMVFYGVAVSGVVVWVIPILLIETMLIAALTLLFSAIQVQFRDLGLAMPLLMQLWMFSTPVVYPLSSVPARFRTLYLLNPMAGVVESFRRVVLQRTAPDFGALGESLIISAILLPLAYIYFKYMDSNIADII
ncbi:MAG: ABC transporter permease [Bryobacteraceae bacterium]|jgi:lipopolysaccharide transport system permease protein